jgi:hypothetical protein
MKQVIKKYLGHHVTFVLTEAMVAFSGDYMSYKKFRWIHYFWMRVVSNYLDSILWHINKKKHLPMISGVYTKNLLKDGYAMLQDINLTDLNFIEFNEDNSRTETHHKVDNQKALEFTKKMGFHKIVKEYLGVTKCNFYSRSWRLNPLPDRKTQHGNLEWHRDRDGYRVLKFFVYLNDVEEGCGEHLIARGSHGQKLYQFVPQRRFADDEVLIKFPIVKIFGKAGQCFVEDTACLHKGSYPVNSSRELIMFMYFTGPIYWEKETIQVSLVN